MIPCKTGPSHCCLNLCPCCLIFAACHTKDVPYHETEVQSGPHFSVSEDGTAKCNLCGFALSYCGGATSNLRRVTHPSIFLLHSDPVVGAFQQQDIDEVVDGPVGPSGPPQTESSGHLSAPRMVPCWHRPFFTTGQYASLRLSPVLWEHQSKTQLQTTMSHCINRPLTLGKTENLYEQLVEHVVKEYPPFSIVEGKLFRQFVYVLDLNCRCPMIKMLSLARLPRKYAKVHRGRGEKAATKRFAWQQIVGHLWETKANISLTAHWLMKTVS